MAYMMTCGHNSDDEDGCPFDCPGSKKLFEVEKAEPELDPEEIVARSKARHPELEPEEEPEEEPKKKVIKKEPEEASNEEEW